MVLYLIGALSDLFAIRAAIALRAGMPYRVSWRPGVPDVYYPGCTGWMANVLDVPAEVAPGEGLCIVPEDIQVHFSTPQEVKTAVVDGVTVTIPDVSTLLERSELPAEHEAWMWNMENPNPHGD